MEGAAAGAGAAVAGLGLGVEIDISIGSALIEDERAAEVAAAAEAAEATEAASGFKLTRFLMNDFLSTSHFLYSSTAYYSKYNHQPQEKP